MVNLAKLKTGYQPMTAVEFSEALETNRTTNVVYTSAGSIVNGEVKVAYFEEDATDEPEYLVDCN
jgi:hypothetical protein